MKKKVILIFLFLGQLIIAPCIIAQNSPITRGNSEGEIYISAMTYRDDTGFYHEAILYSSNNGEDLSIQFEALESPPEGEMIVEYLINDPSTGVIYNNSYNNSSVATGLWVSFDYGKNWEFKDFFPYQKYVSGIVTGEIIKRTGYMVLISHDYGANFEILVDSTDMPLLESGNEYGESYGIILTDEGYSLYYSGNYGRDYITIQMDSTVCRHLAKIRKGALPGELYLGSWWPEGQYKIFFSDDYGNSWTEKYESEPGLATNWGVAYAAGSKPGSFYVTRRKFDDYIQHIRLYIDYSENYGETLTTYFHHLDEYFPNESPENSILLFWINAPELHVAGDIDQENQSISLTVPYGTNVTSLATYIQISPYASVEPASGEEIDFSDTVIYTVTAENGDKREYSVIVNIAENHENFILSFDFEDIIPPAIGEIDEETQEIHVSLPQQTNLTALIPEISISENATVYPLSGIANDFTDTALYTVTAENGNERQYHVVVWDTLSSVEHNEMRINPLQVFPNPSNGIFHIKTDGWVQDKYYLEIADSKGICIKKEAINIKSNQSIKTHIEEFKPGIFYLNIYKGDIRIETKKILLIK